MRISGSLEVTCCYWLHVWYLDIEMKRRLGFLGLIFPKTKDHVFYRLKIPPKEFEFIRGDLSAAVSYFSVIISLQPLFKRITRHHNSQLR